jgi:thiosulfate reductase cytochrome b subunit
MSNRGLRQTVRWVHLIVGVMLILFVYSPLREVSLYALVLQVFAVPLVTLSGLALWQQPKLSAWLSRRQS